MIFCTVNIYNPKKVFRHSRHLKYMNYNKQEVAFENMLHKLFSEITCHSDF